MMEQASHLMAVRMQKGEKETGILSPLQWHAPSDLRHPPHQPHLLKDSCIF
jgi:hypothetical protein